MTTETLPEVCDHLVRLNGLRFHYRDWPNDGAQTLVLLHGFTGHARSWDTFAASMQPRYRVLALDQRGHGETDWADDYSQERMVEDVAAFVAALKLDNFALLGLSMGGRNAMGYAGARPSELERLVIVDIGPEIATEGSTRIRSGVQANDTFANPEEAIAQMRRGNARADEHEMRHRATNNLMRRDDGTWTWRYDAVLRAPDRGLPRPDNDAMWALARNINVPSLLIRGEHSDVLSVDVAERMKREIPGLTMVTVPDSGHSVPLDNPAGFREAVRGFLD